MKIFCKILLLVIIMVLGLTTICLSNDLDSNKLILKITALNANSIKLEWNKFDDPALSSYILYRHVSTNEIKELKTVSNLDPTFYIYDNYSNDSSFNPSFLKFFLRAKDSENDTLATSNTVTVNFDDGIALAIPQTTEANLNDIVTYSINYNDITNAVAASFSLTYNPNVLSPIQQDDGLIVCPNSLFNNDLMISEFNHDIGLINFSVTQQEEINPLSGDQTIATIDFRVIDGGSPDTKLTLAKYISFDSNDNDNLIQYYLLATENQLIIPDYVDISLLVNLQYRNSLKGLVITIKNTDGEIVSVLEDITDDNPQVTLLPGVYTFEAKAGKYLSILLQDINIDESSSFVELGTLIAGDANDDNLIDDVDLTILKDEYIGESSKLKADFNDDGIVDLIDLTILGLNFNKSGDDLLNY